VRKAFISCLGVVKQREKRERNTAEEEKRPKENGRRHLKAAIREAWQEEEEN